MNRTKAALIHLAISSAALLILICLTLFVWYTYPHYKYEGVLEILALITLVDVIIGPVLTFIVVKPGKAFKEVRMDLTIIAIIQIAAFGYGSWTIQGQHPEILLYSDGQFVNIPASQINPQVELHESLDQSFHIGPKLASFVLPEDPEKQVELSVAFITEGKSVLDFPEYFVPYSPSVQDLGEQSIDTALLFRNDEKRARMEAFLEQTNLQLDDIYLFPLVSYLEITSVIVDRESGAIIGYLEINPY